MRLFTALADLSIAVVTITAPTLGLPPTAPPARVEHALSSLAPTTFVTGSGPAMTECKGCGNSDWCRHCSGSGQGNSGPQSSCSSCKGTGTCQDCLEPEPITPGLHIVR